MLNALLTTYLRRRGLRRRNAVLCSARHAAIRASVTVLFTPLGAHSMQQVQDPVTGCVRVLSCQVPHCLSIVVPVNIVKFEVKLHGITVGDVGRVSFKQKGVGEP